LKRRALLSVSCKEGIVELARGLRELGWDILSTGGTASFLKEAGIAVTLVEEETGFPEILGGKVKTLHPKIHGALLVEDPEREGELLSRYGIRPIHLVAVNLYPFREKATQGKPLEEAVEYIDIGGVSLIRAGAKNFSRVVVLVSPEDYSWVLREFREKGDISLEARLRLAAKAFAYTAAYEGAIAAYFAPFLSQPFPEWYSCSGWKIRDLRYGENPHQRAAFYALPFPSAGTLAQGRLLQGKELSYNNILDLEAGWSLVQEFAEPSCAVIKHTNPCGVASAPSLREAFLRAWEADPLSAYGGVVAFNMEVDGSTARALEGKYIEAAIAPAFTPEARETLEKKASLRLMEVGWPGGQPGYQIRSVDGGFLIQERDAPEGKDNFTLVTSHPLSPEEEEDLAFAWRVVKHGASNAVVVAKDKVTLGIGVGCTSRVGAARMALEQAGRRAKGAVLASDGFIPFPDTVHLAAAAGIRAIVQPGGSIRDEECIRIAEAAGISMVFTGRRYFRH